MTEAIGEPWVVFERARPSNSVIAVAADLPSAKQRGAAKLGLKLEQVDTWVVYQGETAEQAKARVAGSIGA